MAHPNANPLWALLLNGETHLLEAGRDFALSMVEMQRKVHRKAWSRGQRVSVRASKDSRWLSVRALSAADKTLSAQRARGVFRTKQAALAAARSGSRS